MKHTLLSFISTFSVFTWACCATVLGQQFELQWAKTYKFDPTKMNQAVKCLLATDGLIVAGSSIGPAGDSDYTILKYNLNGTETWSRRYDSSQGAQDSLRDVATDTAGNIFVTGTTDTVKLDPLGNVLWHTPYSGRAVVANPDFAYVTGFSEVDFATVQLTNSNGGIGWVRTYNGEFNHEDVSTAITLTKEGDIIVAGGETIVYLRANPYSALAAVRYTPTGIVKWAGRGTQSAVIGYGSVHDIAVDSAEAVYLLGPTGDYPWVVRINSDGTHAWTKGAILGEPTQMKLSSDGNLIVTGAAGNPSQPAIEKLSKTNSTVWSKVIDVATLENAYLRATEVASDGHIYTAGDVWPGVNSRDIIVLKVNADGTTAAQALYDSQNHLADIPQSLAIDTQGNVYITGFSATPEGGTEFLTLKYSAGPTIAQKSDGGMHLEFHTNPGQQYSIEATTDFFNWQSLITNTADANGFVQFDDTNAPTIPFRLYRGHLNP